MHCKKVIKKCGIAEIIHCNILEDTQEMRTNFCLLQNPVGVILPLVKMDVSMVRHEKSSQHQRHNKNAAGKHHY